MRELPMPSPASNAIANLLPKPTLQSSAAAQQSLASLQKERALLKSISQPPTSVGVSVGSSGHANTELLTLPFSPRSLTSIDSGDTAATNRHACDYLLEAGLPLAAEVLVDAHSR